MRTLICSSLKASDHMSTRDALRQYSQWITPVFAMDYSSICNGLLQYLQWITPVLAVDYSSTRNRLRRYSCVNRRKSPFKKEAYTAKSKKYNDGRITG